MSITFRAAIAMFTLATVTACADSSTGPAARVGPAAMSGSSGGGGGGTVSGGGGGTVKVDQIKVSKCFWNAGGEMLIKAASSDPTATLTAYASDGRVIGQVQNGGGSRYGGTVMGYNPINPVTVTIRSSSGGSVDVPTTPFVL